MEPNNEELYLWRDYLLTREQLRAILSDAEWQEYWYENNTTIGSTQNGI